MTFLGACDVAGPWQEQFSSSTLGVERISKTLFFCFLETNVSPDAQQKKTAVIYLYKGVSHFGVMCPK